MMVINCGTKSALHEVIMKYYSSLHTFAISIFDCCPNVTSEIADFYNFFSRQFYSLLFGSTIPLIENEDPHWWAYKSALISTVCFFSVLNIADSLKWILKFSTRSALILIFSIFIMKSNENDRISCLTSSSWNEIQELIFGRKKREREEFGMLVEVLSCSSPTSSALSFQSSQLPLQKTKVLFCVH